MIKYYLNIKRMMVMAVFVMPTLVSAAECLTGEQATDYPMSDPPSDCLDGRQCMGVANNGFAIAVQADQGQGSIECSDFVGRDGEDMHAVTFPIYLDTATGTVNDEIGWTTLNPADSGATYDPGKNVDVMFGANSDGSRCTEFFTDNAVAGYVAAGIKTPRKQLQVVACADNFTDTTVPAPLPKPVPPKVTTNGGCPAPFQNAVNKEDDEYDWIIMGGRNMAGGMENNTAICVDQNVNDETDQVMKRCVERCITPESDVSDPIWYSLNSNQRDPEYTGAVCTGNGDGGRFPIECRVCELSTKVESDIFDAGIPFCWEQAQDVQLSSDSPAGDNTFKLPQPEQGEQGWTVKGRHGSTCYLISGQTQSGYRYSYWAPSGCPN
jgi:hypothetical protein